MISVEELSSKIKNDSNTIIDYIIKSFTEMNNELSKKDEIIKQKDQELINHKNIIDQLRMQQVKSLQSIEDLVIDLKELRKNYEELQKNSESDRIVIIYNPVDILEYPEEIINQYIDKVDLQYLAVEQIFNFINQLIEKGNYRALDNILKRAIDQKLTVLPKEQFNDLTKLLEKYIDSELKENRYPGEVVYYFIKKMNSFRWTELLKDFILRNIDNIETIIFSSQRNQQRDRLILEVLKTYFLLNQFDVTRKFIEDILNNNLISEFESLENKDLMEMLFIATYLENDLLVFDYALKYAGGIDHVNWPERDCYMTYYDVKEKGENISSYINKFKVYSSICKNINFDIKEKVINKMIITLENINKQKQQEENRLNAQVKENKDLNKNLSNKKEENSNKPTKQLILNKDTVEKVTLIKNKDTTCPHDRYPLTFKECNLMYFDNKKKKNRKVEGTIPVKLLYCEKCGWYCANHRILSEIDKQVSLKKVIHTPYSSIDAINRYRELENKEKINSSHFASQPRVENITSKTNTIEVEFNDNNLNDQSALRKLGYSTSKTREERWQILVNKAIPNLGIYKTKSFIKWLINIKQADTTKDNSRAIGEWEYDLSRLNQKYR